MTTPAVIFRIPRAPKTAPAASVLFNFATVKTLWLAIIAAAFPASSFIVDVHAQSEPTVTIAIENSLPVSEGDAVVLTLTRDGGTIGELTVMLTVEELNGDRIPGTAEGVQEVTFMAGNDTASSTVQTIDDDVDNCNSFLIVAVTDGTGYQVEAGSSDEVFVIISEDDTPALEYLLESPAMVTENEGPLIVTTTARTLPGEIQPGCQREISLLAMPLEATSPDDYVALSIAVRFMPADFQEIMEGGDTIWQNIEQHNVGIIDDALAEGNETFQIFITRTPSGEVVPRVDRTIVIVDDDIAELRFSAEPAYLMEPRETVSTLTLSLADGKLFADDQTITLSFSGTAEINTDYMVSDNNGNPLVPPYSLAASAGANSVTAMVTVIDDNITERDETIGIEAEYAGVMQAVTIMIGGGLFLRVRAFPEGLVP